MSDQLVTPREHQNSFQVNAAFNSATDIKRFRVTENGCLEAPIKKQYNQPTFNHFDDLTVRECAGIKEKSPFGFEPFVIPKFGETHSHLNLPVNKLIASSKSKNICFIDEVKKAQCWKPGPIYISHNNWNEESIKQKGRFGKYKKSTFIADVIT